MTGVGVGTALTHLSSCPSPLYCPRAALLDRAGISHSQSPLAQEGPTSDWQVGQGILHLRQPPQFSDRRCLLSHLGLGPKTDEGCFKCSSTVT